MRGRTLQLFIIGANPLGLRQVELDNWTGIAVMGPRDQLAEARNLSDLNTPAVYLLTDSIDGEGDVRRVYVGETENFSERGIERNDRLAAWEHFIAFYSKDLNLTKAHVRWLELEVYRLLEKASGRAIVANGNCPPGSVLPTAHDASMRTYLENMVYVLTALGLDFFSPVRTANTTTSKTSAASGEQPTPNAGERYAIASVAGSAAKAFAEKRGNTWILLPGSKVSPEVRALPDGYKALRQSFIERHLIEPTEDGLLTVRSPLEFASPSPPAAIVRGYAINGKWEWRREKDNKRFAEVLEQT